MACFLRPDKVKTSAQNKAIKHKEPQTAKRRKTSAKRGKPDEEM